MASITTYSHCVVNHKLNTFATGTKEEIVNSLLTWVIVGSNNQLVSQHQGYDKREHFCFGCDEICEYTSEEMYKECIKFLFTTLKDYGYKYFRDVG